VHPHDTTSNDLALSDRIELAARRALFAAAPPDFGCAVIDVPGTGATLMRVPALPAPSMNRVVGLPGAAALDDATLAWIRQAYRDGGLHDFWLHAWDLPVDAALHAGYLARGWQPDTQAAWAKCLCDLDEPLPSLARHPSLLVREARGDEALVSGAIVCRSFGMAAAMAPWMGAVVGRPDWRVFFAVAGGVPVATAALFIDGPRAWLGMGATLTEARRQGSQQLLLAARLAAARTAGCRVAGIETEAPPAGATRQSLSNIRRAGFREIGRRLNFRCLTDQPPDFTP
jgi:GNAT superfamily N-acetyltransferase